MRCKILYSPQALKDMDEIWDYIGSELRSPESAEKTVAHIMEQVDMLADFPEMGTPLSLMVDYDTDFRYLVCGNYMAFYEFSGDMVMVSRILYGRRDFLRILRGENDEQ